MSVCVLGGGISGLSLAWFLRRSLGVTKKIVLIEGSDRAGGWLRTAKEGDFLFEKGARSFRPSMNGVEMLRLVEELGLKDDVHVPDITSKTRYIYANGSLQKLPSSIGAVLSHPLMKGVPQSGVREMFVKKSTESDESIHDFIERRFSLHVAENLIDPLISGIYAGDTKKLSIKSCLNLLHTLEQDHGSIVRGMLIRSLPKASGDSEDSEFVTTASKYTSLSFKGGMQTITDKLISELIADPYTEIMLGNQILSVAEGPGTTATSEAGDGNLGLAAGMHVVVANGGEGTQVVEASHVFSTLPAPNLAQILQGDGPESADYCRACNAQMQGVKQALSSIPMSSVAVINLGFDAPVLEQRGLGGFGYLVPSRERQGILGATWDSSVFPHQDPHYAGSSDQNTTRSSSENLKAPTRITVMAGGAHCPDVAEMNEEQLIALATHRLRDHLGIDAVPCFAMAEVMRDCIPQYLVGHSAKVDRLKAALQGLCPSMTLLGNSFQGVGVSDCVANAREAAESYAKGRMDAGDFLIGVVPPCHQHQTGS